MIAVVRHQQAAKELVDLETTDVINSSDEDVSVAVKKITNGTGVDYAIDSIGGEHGTTLATCVKKMGTFSYWGYYQVSKLTGPMLLHYQSIQRFFILVIGWMKQLMAKKN